MIWGTGSLPLSLIWPGIALQKQAILLTQTSLLPPIVKPVHVCLHVCVQAGGSQRMTTAVTHQTSSACFSEAPSLTKLGFVNGLGWPASLKEPPISTSPEYVAGFFFFFFNAGSGSRTWILTLAWQVSYSLSRLPSPQIVNS